MLKKILISCGVLLALLGLYAAIGFYFVPWLVRDQLPGLLGGVTGQRVQLRAAHFDPFDFRADLQDFELSLADGKPLLSFSELDVDVDVIASVKQGALVVGALRLREPVADIRRAADGRFNFDDLIAKLSQPEQAGPDQAESEGDALPVLIRQVSLEQGQAAWSDATLGESASERFQPIDIEVSELSLAKGATSPFKLSLVLDSGGRLEILGQFSLSELKSEGSIKLDGIALRKAWQLFLQDSMPLEIADGHLSLHADYAAQSVEGRELQVLVDKAGIELKQLVLNEKSKDEALIRLPVFAAKDIRLDLRNQKIDIGSVSGSDADIKAWLQADGRVNYQALFAGGEPVAAAQAPAGIEPAKPWQITLGELVLANHRIVFTDLSQVKPVEMIFDQLNCSLHDYRNADNIRLPVQLSTRFNGTGHLKLDGEIGLSPLAANLAVDIQGIKLKTFQTYLDPFLNLELTDGDLSTQGHLQIEAAEVLQVGFQGDASVNNLITRDKIKNLDFVKWDNLALKQMTLDVAKQDFKLSRVVFERPYVRFTIKKDGSHNVGDILIAKTDAKPAINPPPKDAGKPKNQAAPVVTIGKIELKQGQSDFADYSLILPFVVKMNDLSGEVDGFASNTDSAANLKLRGKVRDLATVSIGGKYHLKSGDSDISMSFKHLPLPLVTPYMAEFAGYKIEKGQMALDLKYNIKDGRLDAQNKIFIDQLVLGEKVENPKAVSLPLELGIALLKDGDGKINLDFPVTGSLEDPKFSVGSLVTDVLVNVITKAVSAPFKAIASLFDGEADLSTVGFAPGSSELSADETAKLDQIAKALSVKPELVLEIKGVAYQNQDWPVMRSDALNEILKKMKSGELRDKGEKIRSEYIELSADEYKRLLAKFYAEVFPQKFERTLFGAPRIKDKPDADFYQVAHEELEAVMQPDPQRLNELAVSRANRIAKYLIEQGSVARERIYILATELVETDGEGGIKSRLSLNVAS